MDAIKSKFGIVLSKKEAERFDDEVISIITAIDTANESDGSFTDKVFSHLDVFKMGNNTPAEYVKACEFIMHYGYNKNKTESYKLTFPDRAQRMITEGKAEFIPRAAFGYFSNGIVQNVLAQSAVSIGLIHANKIHDSINILYRLSQDSENERIQMESADKLLGHLTIEEKNTFKVDHTVKTDKRDFIAEMKAEMGNMVSAQRTAILNGGDVKKIANTPVIEAELFDGEDK